MKLGIMQPYFFPYLGYFDLINRTDQWVVFDTPQYTPRTWMNRNRVLHPEEGWQYVTVAVQKFKRFSSIRSIRVRDAGEACLRITGQLSHYAGKAPFHAQVRDLVRETFARVTTDALADLNVSALAAVCDRLGIAFEPRIFSQMGLSLPEITHPGQWALEISHALGASEYVNPPGGRELFDPEAFSGRGIRLAFTDLPDFAYECPGYEFIPHLSILDVMMWNSPETIREWLVRSAAAC